MVRLPKKVCRGACKTSVGSMRVSSGNFPDRPGWPVFSHKANVEQGWFGVCEQIVRVLCWKCERTCPVHLKAWQDIEWGWNGCR